MHLKAAAINRTVQLNSTIMAKRSLPTFLTNLPQHESGSNSPPRKRRRLKPSEGADYFMGHLSLQDHDEPVTIDTSGMVAAERESRLSRERERMRQKRARETSRERQTWGQIHL